MFILLRLDIRQCIMLVVDSVGDWTVIEIKND